MPPVVVAVAATVVSIGLKIAQQQQMERKIRAAKETQQQATAIKQKQIQQAEDRRLLALKIEKRKQQGEVLANLGTRGIGGSILTGAIASIGSSFNREQAFLKQQTSLEAQGVQLASDATIAELDASLQESRLNTVGSIFQSVMNVAGSFSAPSTATAGGGGGGAGGGGR